VRTGVSIGWLTIAVMVAAAGAASQAPDTTTRSVVDAAAAYVAGYQRQLTSTLADEIYIQDIIVQTPRELQMPRTRRMRSEVFFMFAPADRDWMAIRDVLAVDGNTLGERPDLREALRTLAPRDVATRFKQYNSRFNIGRIARNFNEPTLSLLVLDARHRARFSFERRRVERSGGDVLVTLEFTERESPTLIHDLVRGRVMSKGELVVEAGSGLVRRTRLTAKIEQLRIELITEYARDDKLGMWVPSAFREEYEYGGDTRAGRTDTEHERVLCEAHYTNFRRFETAVRIK
jgi:hypothetical protein